MDGVIVGHVDDELDRCGTHLDAPFREGSKITWGPEVSEPIANRPRGQGITLVIDGVWRTERTVDVTGSIGEASKGCALWPLP